MARPPRRFCPLALAACTSPHYPIRDDQTPGPAPLSAPEPKYPISQSAPPPAASAPAQTDAAAAEPTSPQIAAPVATVESQAAAAGRRCACRGLARRPGRGRSAGWRRYAANNHPAGVTAPFAAARSASRWL